MNEIRRPDRDAEEVARIREIGGGPALPDFVTGFDVELGEFDGEPSMWINFQVVGDRPSTAEARKARALLLRGMRESIHYDLLEQIEGRYPYYRFVDTERSPQSAP